MEELIRIQNEIFPEIVDQIIENPDIIVKNKFIIFPIDIDDDDNNMPLISLEDIPYLLLSIPPEWKTILNNICVLIINSLEQNTSIFDSYTNARINYFASSWLTIDELPEWLITTLKCLEQIENVQSDDESDDESADESADENEDESDDESNDESNDSALALALALSMEETGLGPDQSPSDDEDEDLAKALALSMGETGLGPDEQMSVKKSPGGPQQSSCSNRGSLINVGNTCYQDSILQALFASKNPLAEHILTFDLKTDQSNDICRKGQSARDSIEIRELIQQELSRINQIIQSTNAETYNVTALQKLIRLCPGTTFEDFSGCDTADAAEYLNYLFRLFPNTSSLITVTRRYATNNRSLTYEDLDRFEYRTEPIFAIDYSPVILITSFDLQQIPRGHRLNLVDKLNTTEETLFDEQYLMTPVEGGPSYSKKVEITTIIGAPALIFSLHRYQQNRPGVFTTFVNCPRNIELKYQNNVQRFSLSAVVIFTPNPDHYTCYFRSDDDNWCLYNDITRTNRITEIGNYERLLTHDNQAVNKRGTIYFYNVNDVSIDSANCLLNGGGLSCLVNNPPDAPSLSRQFRMPSLSKRTDFPGNVNEYSFKYTLDQDRIEWTTAVYPILNDLLDFTNSIPFDQFPETLQGTIYDLIIPDNLTEEELYDDDHNDIYQYQINRNQPIDITLKNVKLQRCYFGGIAFEVLSDLFDNNETLRAYVDPTGDIDCELGLNFDNKIIGEIPLKVDNRINNIINQPVQWLFDQIYERRLELENILKNSNCDFFDLPYDPTIIKYEKVNPGYLIIQLNPDSDIRVQLLLKARNSDIPDHILEFVWPIQKLKSDDPNETIRLSARMCTKNIAVMLDQEINSFYNIPSIESLLTQQLDAYQKRRKEQIQYGFDPYSVLTRHKNINHVGRIIYLLSTLNNNIPTFNNISINKRQYQKTMFITKIMTQLTYLMFYARGRKKIENFELTPIVKISNQTIAGAFPQLFPNQQRDLPPLQNYPTYLDKLNSKFLELQVDVSDLGFGLDLIEN
jgi:hypothetical protein